MLIETYDRILISTDWNNRWDFQKCRLKQKPSY